MKESIVMVAYNPNLRGYIYDIETGLYYLQSRYYNPKVGRFINADGYVATGQGFIGNNMFAYCLNNPVNFVDYSGNSSTPFLSDTFVGLTEKTPLMKQYKDTLSRDHIAVPDEVVSDQNAEPAWTTIGNALINNFELSVGVGLGLYGGTTVYDAIDFSMGIYGNNGVLSIEDGTINYGQDLYVGFEFSFWVFNFGFNEYIYKQNGTVTYNQCSSGFYMDETLSIGTSGYFYGGLSFSIGFDIVQFCYDTWHLF